MSPQALSELMGRLIDVVQDYQRLSGVLAVGIAALLLVRYIQSPYRSLPPGPIGLPILGNALSLITKSESTLFSEWKQTYGALTYFTVLGQRMLVINSSKAAIDLLDRRSSNTSDRPRNVVAYELLSGGNIMVLKSHDAVWRRTRRAAHDALNKEVAYRYNPMQTTEAILLASDFLAAPNDWRENIQRRSASLILSIIYDHPPMATDSESTQVVKNVNIILNRWLCAAKPGQYLVQFLPWMMYIPRRFAKWRREAEEHCQRDTVYFQGLIQDVKERMGSGTIRQCFASDLIENATRNKLTSEEDAWLGGLLYLAGMETSGTMVAWFILAILLYPETQHRAQAELDAVVGRSRVPSFADFDQLPYIQAMVKEVLRWRSPSLLGVPHTTSEDDWYNGMFIPKGTTCIPNMWILNNDPELFGSDAASFNPARYLDEAGNIKRGLATEHFSYGFGRRICVGQHVASNTLFINFAVMLWSMEFERVKGENDEYVPLDADQFVEEGLAVHPLPFDCRIVPRFPEASLILEHEKELRSL